MDNKEEQELQRVLDHAIALELELARYAAAYGVTDEARRLLKESPLPKT